MKDIEWLKDRVSQASLFTDDEGSAFGDSWVVSRNVVIGLIDQLDEPEVLSQEWIDEHTWNNHYVGRPFVYVDDIQEVLVPKQELPVIPDYVAEWIDINKEKYDLVQLFWEIGEGGLVNLDVDRWIEENPNTFVRAWLDGYTVEEKKYRIHFGNHKYAQRFNEKWLSSQITDKEFASTFTKEEIIKLDNSDLYWNNFAEEVTE